MPFLFSDEEYQDIAYLIIPNAFGNTIMHQFGCVGCEHWTGKGFIVPIADDLAYKFDEALECGSYSREKVQKIVNHAFPGLRVEKCNEAFAVLSNGYIIATRNCD